MTGKLYFVSFIVPLIILLFSHQKLTVYCNAIEPIYDRFFYSIRFGFHDIFKDYEDDSPRLGHNLGPIPFGMPAGFLTRRGKGPPVGLLAYLLNYSSSADMWRDYYATHENNLIPYYRRYGRFVR